MQLCGRDCLLMRLLLLVFFSQTDVTQPAGAGVHVETNREPFWRLGSLVMTPSSLHNYQEAKATVWPQPSAGVVIGVSQDLMWRR